MFKHKDNGVVKGYILAVISVFFWSFNVIVSKNLVGVLTPWQISFGRWFVALIVLIPFTISGIIKYRKIIAENFVLILFMSITGVIFSNTFVYIAGHTITAIDMSLIGITGPIFLVLFSFIFLSEKIKKQQIYGLLVAVFGILIVVARGSIINLENFSFQVGDLWMLCGSMSFGIYGTLMRKKPKELPLILLLSMTIMIAVILIFPIFIQSLEYNQIFPISNKVLGVLIYLGIVNSILCYLAWNTALNKFGSMKISVMYYLMPLFSMVESYFILKEKIALSQIYGGFFVILGILLIEFYGKYKIRIERV